MKHSRKDAAVSRALINIEEDRRDYARAVEVLGKNEPMVSFDLILAEHNAWAKRHYKTSRQLKKHTYQGLINATQK